MKWRALLFLLCLSLQILALPTSLSAASFADAAFESVWHRTDLPIADGRVARSWMWGPEPFTEAIYEPYAQSPGGNRLVQYFDKSRMEINDPYGDRSSQWFVTNGLLVREMVDGRVQIGDTAFEDRNPAEEAVAGDPVDSNPNCPLYASLTHLSWEPAENRLGQKVTSTLVRDGTVGDDPSKAEYVGTEIAYFEETTGHNVPQVLWDFMNQSGLIYIDGSYQTGKVVDWLFAMGYPISEPYWARCTVGGQEKDVLIQLFERRVLTYTPANPVSWQVEMGNVGQHYYNWRYGAEVPPPPPPLPPQDVFTGSGDAIVTFERPAEPAIVHIVGNAESDYFSVTSYTGDWRCLNLLVNTNDPYDGIRPLDFNEMHAERFVVHATGRWTIEILPLAAAHTIWLSGSIQGTGDDVIALAGATPDQATISGNAGSTYFGIISYDITGQYVDLLVNTVDPYEGTVLLTADAAYLEVMAEGEWDLSVTAR
jgi:hypothetical protein